MEPATDGAAVSTGGLAAHATTGGSADTVTRIAPTSGWAALHLRELWEYRELLWFLSVRDIKVRYKQTVLGATWAVLQPLVTAVAFAIVFGRVAKLPSEGVPYGIFALAGLVVWTFFASALGTASLSLVNDRHLVSKVYFPRLCVPISATMVFLVDLLVSCGVLAIAMIIYDTGGGWRILLAPAYVLMAYGAGLGLSLWLAALATRHRDVKHVVPFLVQFGLFVTPVAYSASVVDDKWLPLYGLNPMAGAVEGFRWAVLGTDADVLVLTISSLVSTVLVLVGGAFYFRRLERVLADVI